MHEDITIVRWYMDLSSYISFNTNSSRENDVLNKIFFGYTIFRQNPWGHWTHINWSLINPQHVVFLIQTSWFRVAIWVCLKRGPKGFLKLRTPKTINIGGFFSSGIPCFGGSPWNSLSCNGGTTFAEGSWCWGSKQEGIWLLPSAKPDPTALATDRLNFMDNQGMGAKMLHKYKVECYLCTSCFSFPWSLVAFWKNR